MPRNGPRASVGPDPIQSAILTEPARTQALQPIPRGPYRYQPMRGDPACASSTAHSRSARTGRWTADHRVQRVSVSGVVKIRLAPCQDGRQTLAWWRSWVRRCAAVRYEL